MAEALKTQAEEKNLKAIAIKVDLTKEREATEQVDKTVAYLGGLDILINNAGSLVARNRIVG